MMKLIVLMSTYNGEKYIREQLDSLLNQTLKPDKIFIRDDGSSDSTIAILEEYRKNNDCIDYYVGDNKKPARSFFELINVCECADYYALCDQDDFWFEDKLETAVKMLEEKNNELPLLYCSRFTMTDQDLNPINSDISKLYSYTDFPHSLLYQTAPGCTFVFNHAAREEVVKYDIEKEYCIIHDSLIHKIVLMKGEMILDPASHMYYRQHSNNAIGLSADKKKVFFGRVKRFFTGKLKNSRRDVARSLLNVYGDELDQEKLHLLEMVAHYDTNIGFALSLMFKKCFRTGSINDLFFAFMVLFKYI